MGQKIDTSCRNNDTLILMCAFRYALGRRTYVVDCVVEEILQRWYSIHENDRKLFVKEILEHENRFGNLGMECDARSWKRIVERANEDGLFKETLV